MTALLVAVPDGARLAQGTHPDPPKQYRDALKLANVNLGSVRHVILMTEDVQLLDKMSMQGLVHALMPPDTLRLLRRIVAQYA